MPAFWGERIAAAVFIALAVFMGLIAWEFPHGGGMFPLFSMFGIIGLSGLLFYNTLGPKSSEQERKLGFDSRFQTLKPLWVCLLVFAYLFVMFELGYYLTTAIFLVTAAWLVGVRNVKTIALTTVILLPLMYAFFELFLQANLPRGIFL